MVRSVLLRVGVETLSCHFRIYNVVLFSLLILCVCSVYAEESFDKPLLIEKSTVPELPRLLSKNPAKGIALVKVSVSASGDTTEVNLVRSTGIKPLDTFVAEWINEWKFLPKLVDNQTADGFTVISLRYDLSASQFVTPPVYELPLTLPEAYQTLWMTEDADNKAIQGTTPEEKTFDSGDSIKIDGIPPEIQSLNLAVGTVLHLSIDESGNVLNVKRPVSLRDDTAWAWIQESLMKTQWPKAPGKILRRLEIPMILNSSKCKIEFGEAKIVE